MNEVAEVLTGSCLCGGVTYEVWSPFLRFAHCHCRRCRKATGTGHATNLYCSPERFRWVTGEELLSRYDLPSASSFATVTCSTCGCLLPRLTRSGREVVVPAGSLDVEPSVAPNARIFCNSKVSWSCDHEDIRQYAELPEWWTQ